MSTTIAPEIGTTIRVPLADFVVDANIRKDTTLPKEFVSSVKQHGVLVPVDAYLNADDQKWHLQDGQLRFLASMDVGHADILVLVADPATAEAVRIQRQLILNERRNQLTESDRVGAYQTLFELGVSPDQIARKTNTPTKRVQTALAVAASPAAAEALATVSITLERAAAIAEFEDDGEAVKTLVQRAEQSPDNFDRAVVSLRLDREYAAAAEALETALARAGYTVTELPKNLYEGEVLALGVVFTDEKLQERIPVDEGDRPAATTPGLAVAIEKDHEWNEGNYLYIPRAKFYIDGVTANGFFAQPWRLKSSNDSGSVNGGGGLTEEQKAARKVTRDNNKLWGPATVVRRAWIKELLQRPELPADALTYVAEYFGDLPHWAPSQREMRNELLGLDTKLRPAKWLTQNRGRQLNLLLGTALASVEGVYDFGKDGWRSSEAQAHVKRLQAWGFGLSDIELAVLNGTAENGLP